MTFVSGIGTGALALANPQGVAIDSSENIFIADTFNHRIIRVTPAGTATVVAGVGYPLGPGSSGDGSFAINAQLNTPSGVAVDAAGNIYVADTNNHKIRKFTVGGNITTIAGTGTAGSYGDYGYAINAQLNRPVAVAVDSAGTLYIVDTNNSRIRMVQNGIITTVAGTGVTGFAGDGGLATSANLSFPAGIAIDSSNNIYITDNSSRIRKFTVGGNIVTVAGGSCCGSLGDGGPATAASLNNAVGVGVDSFGNTFVVDSNNNRIRMVSAQTGMIATIQGNGAAGGAMNQVNFPRGLAVDSRGTVYVADSNNNRILRIAFSQGTVSVLSAAGPPNTIVQVPVIVALNPGVFVDSLGLTIVLPGPAAAPLTFTPGPGISSPSVVSASTSNVVLAWNNNLSSAPGQPAGFGMFQLGTIGVSIPNGLALGTQVNITITQIAGDLTAVNGSLTQVALTAGPPGILTVAICSYLVGDPYLVPNPQTNTSCGQFGDNQISFEDVVLMLRVWGNVPGWAVPPCSDLFDSMDTFPVDNPAANPPVVGGDGQLTLADLQVQVNRWGNLDALRPRRSAGSYLAHNAACPAPHFLLGPMAALRRPTRPRRPVEGPVAAIVELGAAEVLGNTMRVPMYLRSSQLLESLGISVGWEEQVSVPLRFSSGKLPNAILVDTEVPGRITAAWFGNVPDATAARIVLGYVEWDRAQGINPGRFRLFAAEAGDVNLMPLRLESRDGLQP